MIISMWYARSYDNCLFCQEHVIVALFVEVQLCTITVIIIHDIVVPANGLLGASNTTCILCIQNYLEQPLDSNKALLLGHFE